MSMSPLPCTSASTIEPMRIRVQSRRRGLPTTIFVTLRSWAKARRASLIFCPGSRTVSAPSCSASLSVCVTRSRTSDGSRSCAGVSTYAATHGAPSRSAMRLPARTRRADSGPGLMHTRSRSAVGQALPIACSCMYTRICASTRSAVRRIGRQVDQLDVVGLLEHRVGHRLAHHHPGDLRDDVVERLEMLDIHGRVDVDAGVE